MGVSSETFSINTISYSFPPIQLSEGWRSDLALQASLPSVMEAGQLPCCLWSPLMRCNIIPSQHCAGFLPLPLSFVLFHCCASENKASCAILMYAKPLCTVTSPVTFVHSMCSLTVPAASKPACNAPSGTDLQQLVCNSRA